MTNYDDNPTKAVGLALVIPFGGRRRNRVISLGQGPFFLWS